MKRGWRIALMIVGMVLAAIVTTVLWPPAKEPEHEGKKLSEWLAVPIQDAKKEGADEAVRYIGTNGIPWLLRWVGDQKPAIRDKVRQWTYKRLPGLRKLGVPRSGRLEPSTIGKWSAAHGFLYLGEEGRSAVPALTEMALQTNQQALIALELMGPTGTSRAGKGPTARDCERSRFEDKCCDSSRGVGPFKGP